MARVAVNALVPLVVVALLGGAACSGSGGSSGTGAGGLESSAILARVPRTDRAEIRHVLIGWEALEPNYGGRMDGRGKIRPRAQADELARQILDRARGGEDFQALVREYSEDWASARNATLYTVTPTASLVPPFKALSLRLEPGEIGVVETVYGWHVIKRVE